MTTQEPQKTSTSNVQYDLVSMIYHALESALSSSIYVTDAQWIGDQELARFFWNNQQEDRQVADQAESLLGQRLSQSQPTQSQFSQSQQGQVGQQGMYGQQGQLPWQGMYGQQRGFGQGMYGGGYGYGPGMYGGYGNPFGGGYGGGMYGGYGYSPGMYGGYGNPFGGGMYGGGYGNPSGVGMYSGQFGGGQFGGTGTPTLRQITGTSDVTYDLISTIYHALEGAQTSDAYVRDAQQASDQEMVQFIQQTQQKYNQRAEQAKQLLAPRLSHKRWQQSQRQGGMGGSYYTGQGTQTGSSQTAGSGTSTSGSQSSSSSGSS